MLTKVKISSYLFILLFAVCEISFSQKFGWKSYTEKEGLPHAQISTLFQSEDGFIWVGTYVGGLGRFSSSGWKYLRSSDNLPSNWITCIDQNPSTGQYFLGTVAGVVSYKDKIANISSGTLLENQNITALRVISNDIILAGTLTGLYRYNLQTGKAEKLSELWITAIKSLDMQRVLIADKSGLFVYNITDAKIEKSPFQTKLIIPSDDIYGNFYITSIYCESPDHVWLGTSFNRVFEFNKGNLEEYVVSEPINIINKINDVCKDRDGFVWIATDRGLFYILNKNIYQIKNNNLNNTFISSLLLDYENNIWVGTNNGLWKSSSKAFISFGDDINPKENNCFQIIENGYNEYIIGTLKGLLKLKFNYSIFEKPESRLYQPAAGSGLGYLEFKFLSLINYHNTVYSNDRLSSRNYSFSGSSLLPVNKYKGMLIFKDPNNQIWTYNRDIGAILIHSEKNIDTIYIEKEKKIEMYSIVFHNHEAYVCTINGIYVVSNKKVTKHITVSDGLASNSVQNLFIDKNGIIWCSTENGINILDKITGKWFTLNTTSGLLNNFTYWIFEDRRKSIWIGTPQGVNRINHPDDLLNDIRNGNHNISKHIKNYGQSEGLGSLDCNQNGYLVDSKGRVWINTIDNINLYLEQYDQHPAYSPKIAFSKIEINNKEASVQDFQNLSAGADLLTFYFAGNSFIDESAVKYKYFLEGYDKDYSSPTSLAFAQYHNIPPGKYIFHLRAISKNGVESAKEASISFEIKALFPSGLFRVQELSQPISFFVRNILSLFLIGQVFFWLIFSENILRNKQ